MPQVPRRISLLLLLLPILAISGCFPSSFELKSDRAVLTDDQFVLLHEGFFHETGESTIVGRVISYEVDNYAGVWTNDAGLTIVLITTPSVPSMSMEANPVANMGPRALLERVLAAGADAYAAYAGLPPIEEITLENEQFARLSTNFGGLNGSRFLARAGDVSRTAIIVHGKHVDDFLVILAVFDPQDEPESLRAIHRVLNTLEHPAVGPEDEEAPAGVIDVTATEQHLIRANEVTPLVP